MFANGIKFGYYRKEAEQQKELFRKKYRDAAKQLGNCMDQLFGLEDSSTARCSPSTANRKRSKSQSSFAKKRSKVGPRCKEADMLQCSSIPETLSNNIGSNMISCIRIGEVKVRVHIICFRYNSLSTIIPSFQLTCTSCDRTLS